MKPWYRSKAVWSNIGGIVIGVCGAVWTFYHDHDVAGAFFILQSALNGGGIYGRVTATQPIGPVPEGQGTSMP